MHICTCTYAQMCTHVHTHSSRSILFPLFSSPDNWEGVLYNSKELKTHHICLIPLTANDGEVVQNGEIVNGMAIGKASLLLGSLRGVLLLCFLNTSTTL